MRIDSFCFRANSIKNVTNCNTFVFDETKSISPLSSLRNLVHHQLVSGKALTNSLSYIKRGIFQNIFHLLDIEAKIDR